ncbi:MAG: hypothetical protein Q8M98_07610 [Candidatus Cloacimonadaceae bacterium]|nr:hypothetical protein [Candidatus Cloacimonadaceae bacterium]MDP3114630.1 hypothetical protein [Candidatus Cloacimonadaceae bacterium]
MKNILIIIVLCLSAAGLCAQRGLFGISFDQHLNSADSIMVQQGFIAQSVDGAMVKYYSDYNDLIDAVVLFVNPENEKIVGWFVKYDPKNGEEKDKFVVDRMYEMHGDPAHFDPETQQLIWVLNPARSIHLMYVNGGSLTILYRDSDYEKLFLIKKL